MPIRIIYFFSLLQILISSISIMATMIQYPTSTKESIIESDYTLLSEWDYLTGLPRFKLMESEFLLT